MKNDNHPVQSYQSLPVSAAKLTAQNLDAICLWLNDGTPGDDGDRRSLRVWFYDSNGDAELYVDTETCVELALPGNMLVLDSQNRLSIMEEKDFLRCYQPSHQ
jgi:hypothetical protein